MTQRLESAKTWSNHQGLGGNGPCRREKGGSPAFLKSCGCAPPLKWPVGDQLQLRNARATWSARPVVGARHHRRSMCAVARHAKHVGGRGRHTSAWTARDGQCIRRTLTPGPYTLPEHALTWHPCAARASACPGRRASSACAWSCAANHCTVARACWCRRANSTTLHRPWSPYATGTGPLRRPQALARHDEPQSPERRRERVLLVCLRGGLTPGSETSTVRRGRQRLGGVPRTVGGRNGPCGYRRASRRAPRVRRWGGYKGGL